MFETHAAHTKQLQSLSESRMGSKVTKPTFSNSAKRYKFCNKKISVCPFSLVNIKIECTNNVQ